MNITIDFQSIKHLNENRVWFLGVVEMAARKCIDLKKATIVVMGLDGRFNPTPFIHDEFREITWSAITMIRLLPGKPWVQISPLFEASWPELSKDCRDTVLKRWQKEFGLER